MFPAPVKLKKGDLSGKTKAKTKKLQIPTSARNIVAPLKDKKFLQVEVIKEEPLFAEFTPENSGAIPIKALNKANKERQM